MTISRYLRVDAKSGVEIMLDLFVRCEEKWCHWDKLEESIAKVDYDQFSDKYLEWFEEFLINCAFRIWRSSKEDPELNRVKDEGQAFMIINYDWNAYKFGRQKGLDKDLTTKKILCIDKSNLNDKEIKWLRSKCK